MSKGIVNRMMGGTIRHSWALTMIILVVCLGLVSSSAFASGSNFVRTAQQQVTTMEKAAAFEDVDNDGLKDIVIGFQSHEWPASWSSTDRAQFTIRWYKNNGNSDTDNWTVGGEYVWTASAFPTDLDGGHTQYNSFNKIDWVSDIKVANLNSDVGGKKDILFSTHVEGVKWIENGGPSGAWAAGNFGDTGTNPIHEVTTRPGTAEAYYPNVRRLLAVDLDNDLDMDIVFAQAESGASSGANQNSIIRVFYGNGSDAFTETTAKPLIASELLPFCVSLRAFDLVGADNRPEIVATGIGGATAATDRVRVIQTAGTDNTIVESGNLNLTPNYGADPFDTGIGKIDGDSFMDLVVVSSQAPTVTWYKGNGTLLGFSYAGSIDNGTRVGTINTMSPRSDYYPVFCSVTDWDMDGDADIVASYFSLSTPAQNTGAVVYYENTGIYSATFSSEYLPISNSGPYGEDIHPMMVDMAAAQQEINASPSIDNFQDIVVAQLGTVNWPPAPPTAPTPAAGSGTVSFWNNIGYRSFGPVVTGAAVLTEPDFTHRRVQITFSRKMDASGATGDPWNVLNPANYVASGPATSGWATFTPQSVTKISDTVWQLNFTGAQLLADGANLTITCSGNLREVDGTVPDYVPLQNPKDVTVTCRMDLTVTDVFTYTDWDPLMTANVIIDGGCGAVVKEFKWDSADALGNVLSTLKAWSSATGADQLQLTHPLTDYQYFFSYVRDTARLTEEVRTNLVTLRAMPPLTASVLITLPGPPKDYGYTGRSGDDFTLVATPAGGYGPDLPDAWGPYTYQWQRWNGTSWDDLPQLPTDYVRTLPGEPTSQDVTTTISGGTSATLTVVNGIATFDDKLYRCRVRDAKYVPLGRTAYSNEVWVRLSDNPNFSDQPDSANQYIGNTHHLEVSIIGGLPPYTKTWQKWTETFPGSGVWAWTTVPGSTNDRMLDLTGLTVAMAGDYRCYVVDSDSVVGISDVATVNVREKVHFTTQPAASTTIRTAQDLMTGGAADPFVVVVAGGYPDVYLGGNYQYEWQRDIGGGLGVIPDGAQARTMYPGGCSVPMTTTFAGRYSAHLTIETALKFNGDTVTPVVFDEGTYSCYAFDGNTTVPIGDGPSKTSNNAILTIQDLVAVVVDPVESPKKYVGESTQFSVTLIGGSGPNWDYDTMGYGYQYVWVSKGINPLPGSGTETVPGCFNGNTFTAGPLTALLNGDINCEVWDYMPPVMGGGTGRASSAPALLNVATGVTVTTPSGPTHRNVGQSATYTVTASNGWPGYTYEWQFYDGVTWHVL
nr:VCBS repeat-containing protein [Candidatus Hydrogenedentota bacterium]